MAGIDNIVNEILQEAKDKADGILKEAADRASALTDARKSEGQKLIDQAKARAEADEKDYAGRVDSQIELRARQSMLNAKQSIIDDIVKKAYDKLDGQDDASYFSMLEKLIGKAARAEEGTILMSARDKARLPGGFSQILEKIAKEKGGKLTIAEEDAKIDNGFILRYGGLDENCSLKSLFDERLNDLKDQVNQVLW